MITFSSHSIIKEKSFGHQDIIINYFEGYSAIITLDSQVIGLKDNSQYLDCNQKLLLINSYFDNTLCKQLSKLSAKSNSIQKH